jgi:hypothetical protein
MKTKKNKQELFLKIQKIKELVKDLENLEQKENNQEAGIISQLLKMISSMFEDVEQRLKELEKQLTTNHE